MTGGGLLLAAGSGQRFGGDKRRARMPDGRTLLEATLSRWCAAFTRVRVVLRDRASQGEVALAASLRESFPALEVTFAARWQEGMGASLAAGVRDCDDWAYVWVGLGDMPWVRVDTLKALQAALDAQLEQGHENCIVRPAHGGEWGQPVGFGPAHRDALSGLGGDQGARDLIRRHPGVIEVECHDLGVVRDIDTPEALRR